MKQIKEVNSEMEGEPITTDKEIAEVFREALKILWDGEGRTSYLSHKFICTAISYTSCSHDLKAAARMLIQERLRGSPTLGHWLSLNGVPEVEQTQARVQVHRQQWLIALIEELENEAKAD